MSASVEYNGHVIEPTTRIKQKPYGWTLEVRITPAGRKTGVRLCRAPNLYPTEELAVQQCLRFGRKIVDGELTPRGTR
jgi:hypothetical protein